MKTAEIKFYLDALKSDECQCGCWKQKRKSFCYVCYGKLPHHIQRGLYKHIGHGYEEMYEEAVAFLTN